MYKSVEESNDNPNCYYKQLARKTAECEELHKINKSLEKPYLQVYYKAERFEKALDVIEKLIEDSLDVEKTDAEQSIEALYKALDIINKVKGGEE